jgi:hypothetical protein
MLLNPFRVIFVLLFYEVDVFQLIDWKGSGQKYLGKERVRYCCVRIGKICVSHSSD